ncbi:Acetyltransferase pyr8 [Paramyrothecium foliicola]|nr:Acetyltransferase pyr8 [Paramyrothecium foliicola]
MAEVNYTSPQEIFPVLDTTSTSVQTTAKVLVYCAAQVLLPAVLIATTAKHSFIRFFGIPGMTLFAYQIYLLAPALSSSVFHTSFLACEGILLVAHCINLLLINGGVDWDDLVSNRAGSPGAGIVSKVVSAARLVVSLRGVHTGWETKGLPAHPASLSLDGKPVGRGSFLVRQSAILLWQYLLLDVMLEVTRHEPPENTEKLYWDGIEYEYFTLTGEQWFTRVLTPFISWFVVSRLLLDSTWRALSLIFVGLDIDGPEGWRPLFGSMWDAYTLRNFWGAPRKFWHQILRWPFSSNTNFFNRRILGLPHPSLLDRYANNLGVFFLSGVLHAVSSNIMGLTASESGAIPFFSSFALGFMIEDGVQKAYRQLTGKPDKAKASIWEKVVGFIWVQFWMSLTSPWYMYPSRRQLVGEAAWTLPYNATEKLGMPAMWGLTFVYGLFVKYSFGTSL